MTHGAPAQQDKPDHTLPLLDEVLDLAPALEAEWPSIRATIPAGTLVNDGEGEGEEPGGDTTADTGPEGQPGGGGEEESFYDFDPSSIPQDADAAWLSEQYGNMRKAFTQKTQGIAEARRSAEESQALIEGLRDPETRPHYLQLLGVDVQDAPGVQQADEELAALLEDEPDLEDRVGQLERERAQERQERQAEEELAAYDQLADQELEAIEGQWGRKLTPEQDTFLRFQAESNPGPDGLPDYAAAAKLLKGILNQGVEQELKRRQEPGRGATGGQPGGKALDPNKEEDRLALAAAAAERHLASQQ